MSRTFKIALVAIAASAVFAPTALAHDSLKEVSIVVPYADLDMSTAAGAETLLKRIQSAARHVCNDAISSTNIKPRSPAKCRREAVERAVGQAKFDTLTLAWSGRYPVTDIASR